MAIKNQNVIVKKPQSFDDALIMTGFGKFHLFVLLAGGGCLMCVIVETMCMMFIVPACQCDLKLSLSDKGLLSSISFFGVVACSYFWGFLADTRGRRTLLIFSLISSSLVSIAGSFVPWSWLFILLRFVNGMLIGGGSAVVYAYVGEFHDNHYRPKVISWVATFVAFGNIYLPAMAWLILPETWSIELPIDINFRPWRLLVIVYALPSLLFAACIYVLPESPKYLMTVGKHEEVLQILTKIFVINTGRKPEEYLVSEILWDELSEPQDEKQRNLLQTMWKQTVPLFKKTFLLKTLMVCGIQFGIFLTTSGAIMWYPEILNSMAHYSREVSSQDVGLCNSLLYEEQQELQELLNQTRLYNKVCKDNVNTEVFLVSVILGLVYAAVYLVIGAIINLVGKKPLLVGFTIITLISGVVAQNVYGYSLLQILIGMYLLGGAGIGVVNAIVVDIYPTQIRGMALSVSLMFGRFGAMAGSNIVGPILYNLCDWTFYIFAFEQIVVMLLIIFLPAVNRIPKIIESIT